MDPNNVGDCDPVAVIQVLRDQARSLRTSATGLYSQADELDGIAAEWTQALAAESGQAGGQMGHDPEPPAPGMRGGPRRR